MSQTQKTQAPRLRVAFLASKAVGLVLSVLLVLGWSSPAQGALPPGCVLRLQGSVGVVVCAGQVLGQLPLPTVEVTETVTEEVIKRVPVPGPTIFVPRPGATVTVPSDTQTVYITQTGPGQTSTVTARPRPNAPAPTSLPSAIPTPSETGTGQPVPPSATIGPAKPLSPAEKFDFGDGNVTVQEATLGLLATLLLVAGFLGTLYAGYSFGYREAEKQDTNFLRSMLESVKRRK